jgi:hypothetical protein
VFVKSTQDVDIWMDFPIQDDVYIWANYSVSSYLNFIPIFWNVLIWLKYDLPSFLVLWHIFFETTAQIPEVKFGGKYGYLRANTDIEGKWPTLTSNYYWTCKNEHIATKYVINIIYMMDHFSSLNRDSYDFVTGFVTRETRRMSHVEQELLNLSQ